jgi:hypothetical protein
MKNKSAFIAVMAILIYVAYDMWQGLLNGEGFVIPRVISILLILIGIVLMLFGRFKAFILETRKNFTK